MMRRKPVKGAESVRKRIVCLLLTGSILLGQALFLTGCQGSEELAELSVESSESVSEKPAESSQEGEPTPSPTPSATPKPTSTPTPSPSATPTPSPTPSPTPESTPTPTPTPTPKPTATPQSSGSSGGYVIPTMLGSSFHADQASGSNGVYIDVSHVSDGYVAASVVSSKRLKFQVVYGDMKYNYDLPSDGTATVFPLQSGDGTYQFRVMENTSGTKYRELYAVTQSVSLKSQFQPFLRPSQYVNYNAYSSCVAKARQLASTASNETEVIAAVYAYITENVSYDYNKAATVQSGYLPNPDSTLSSGTGICFDYAALAAAMLRSVGIPTKLITGYVAPNDIYHAWNMIYTEESGWITVEIQTPAYGWSRIDTTFAATGADATFIGNGSNYTTRYTY